MSDQKPEGAGTPDTLEGRTASMRDLPTNVEKCKRPGCEAVGGKAMTGGKID